MCHEIGLTVTYLKRVRIGGIILPEDLKTGESVLMPDFPEKVKK
jgi:16S rRNA U516 pseudouridylate synthase RsuA-like enzyme